MKTRATALAVLTRIFISARATPLWSTLYSPKEQFSGHSVALNDDLLVVGGPYTSKEGEGDNVGGLVRIYSKSENKIDLFHEIYGHPNDELGYAIDVAAKSKTVIMGAPRSDASGDSRGYVMVMHFNEWKNKWEELGSLITGTLDGGKFGESVAISDDGLVIAVGSKGDGLRLGLVKVYMYEEVSNQWMQIGDHLNGHEVHEEFGLSLDLVGDIQKYYLAMGAPNYKSGRGLVQGYYYNDDLGWMNIGGDITGMHMEDRCGADISLGMEENYLYLAVGTPTTEYYAEEEIGERGTEGHVQVYRYDTNDEDGLWEEFGDEIEEGMEDDETGTSVALSRDGQRLVIGSPRYNNFGGMVRVFDYSRDKFEYSMVGEYIMGEGSDQLGAAVAVFGDEVAIGAEYGDFADIYTFGESKSSRSNGLVLFGILGLLSVVLFIGMKKARRAGFRLSSVGKALPVLGARNRQRNQSTPLRTEEKRDEWPFPFFSEGERARIAQIQRQEQVEEGNVDRVVLHGMIRSSSHSEDGSKNSGISNSSDGISHGSNDDDEDSDEEYDGLRKIT